MGGLGPVLGTILLGVGLALATYGLLQLGRRWLSWRLFFSITRALLLLLTCQMFTSAADKLIGLGVLPFTDPLWDTSWLLNDMGRLGGLVAGLTGYRAKHGLVTVAVWMLYCGVIAFGLRQPRIAERRACQRCRWRASRDRTG